MAQSNWRDWADLADGSAGVLAERVLANDVADYVRFRAVCRPWRQCYTDPRGHNDHRFYPRHWIMLQGKLTPSHRRRFLNVSTGECIKVDLPELCDHEILAVTPEGLLVVLHEQTHVRLLNPLLHDHTHVLLLNPLTRHLTELPPLTTLIPHGRSMQQGVLCGTPFGQKFRACGSGVANDSTVVLCLCTDILGIAKPGDEHWTSVRYENRPLAALFFLDHFYCVTENNLMVLETSANEPPRMEVAARLHTPLSRISDSMHLVGSNGQLMLVHRMLRTNPRRMKYDVYQDVYHVDLDSGKLYLAKSFNGRALLIGMYSSLSVSTDVFPSVSDDAIYFSRGTDEGAVIHIEVYHRANGDTEVTSSNLDNSMSSPHTLVECLAYAILPEVFLGT